MSDAGTPSNTELDLRRLRYFLAVAENLNFGRAAEQLHIAQPVLSRQIRVLEAELGITLFERSSRGTALTAGGAELVEEARGLLRNAEALRARARRAAGPSPRIAIGFMPGVVPTALVRALRERFAHLTVEVLRTSWSDQVEVVHDGRADVSFVRLPIDRRGVVVVPVFSEPRVAVFARDHPLAAAERLTLADLADVPLLQEPSAVPELLGTRAAASARPHPTVEEKLERVAGERGVVILPDSTARFYSRPDVVVRDVEGLAASEVALIHLAHRSSPVIDAAVGFATRWHELAGAGRESTGLADGSHLAGTARPPFD
jgi:DNA-binding transcriptional LysR family regulator